MGEVVVMIVKVMDVFGVGVMLVGCVVMSGD